MTSVAIIGADFIGRAWAISFARARHEVEAARDERLPAQKLHDRQAWRDSRLMALGAHKRKAEREIGS